MRASIAVTALILAVGLAACAGPSGGPLEPGRVRLAAMEVAEDPKVDVRYPVLLRYEAAGDVRIIDSCFTWLDENASFRSLDDWTGLGNGPYCLLPAGEAGPGALRIMVASGYPGTYELRAYVHYEDGGVVRKSNTVSSELTVTRRLPYYLQAAD